MCGIAGIHRLSDRPFPEMDRLAAALLIGIEERGRDATGYVAVNDVGDVQLQKASCRAFYFNQHRGYIRPESRTVLLHTRLATQGKPAFPENNHPVEAGGVYCVHNGHVWNDNELFKRSERVRVGQVDSEAIPALVAWAGWENAVEALADVDGDFAVAMIAPKHPKQLLLARGNHSPLVYVRTEHLLVWASTMNALTSAWKSVLGSPPASSRFRYAAEGDALRVNGSSLETEIFKPKRHRVYWAPKTTKAQVYIPKPVKPSTAVVRYDWDEIGKLQATASEIERLDRGEEEEVLEEGWDILRCEDCGDWEDADNLSHVETMSFTSLLCPTCAQWAVEMMGADYVG